MRKSVLLLLVLFAVGCTNNEVIETAGPMTGDKVNVQSEAYKKMCAREPESPLCKKED